MEELKKSIEHWKKDDTREITNTDLCTCEQSDIELTDLGEKFCWQCGKRIEDDKKRV